MQDALVREAADSASPAFKSYAVLGLDHDRYCAMVLAKNYERPTEQLDAIAQDLAAMGVKGTVVFDYLLANGTRTRRFFEAEFDGQWFPGLRFGLVDGDDRLRAISAHYFASNIDQVSLSLLSPAMRYMVKQGRPL